MKALNPVILLQIEELARSANLRLGVHDTIQEFANESDIVLALQTARSLTMGTHPDSDLIIVVIAALLAKVEVTL